MGNITVAKDINDVAPMTMNLGSAKYGTVEECKETYLHAEDIYDSQKTNVVSVIRSTALISMKKLIMGSFWNAPLGKVPQDLVDGWYKALGDIGELDKNGKESRYVSRLMRFGRVVETSRLKGVRVIVPNEKQLRKLGGLIKNKFRKSADEIELAITYDELARTMNDGKQFKSQDELAKAYENYKKDSKKVKEKKEVKTVTDDEKNETREPAKMVFVRDIFTEEVGDEPTVKSGFQNMEDMCSVFPQPSKALWKKTYHKVAKILHPDNGGDAEMVEVMSRINDVMTLLHKQQEAVIKKDKWNEDYEQWKKDNGYESDFVSEDEL